MEIKTGPVRGNITLLPPASAEGKPLPLKVGEIVAARIINQSAQDQYTVLIKQQSLQLKTPLKLDIGQTVELKVIQSQPQAQLQLVNIDNTQHTISQAMRTLLARQAPASELLANLSQLIQTTRPANLPAPVADPLGQIIKQFLERLATPRQIASGTGLKQAILDSGQFLEQKLTQTPAGEPLRQAVSHDLRANLLRLAQSLKELTAKAGNQASVEQVGKVGSQDGKSAALQQALARQLAAASSTQTGHNTPLGALPKSADLSQLLPLPLRHQPQQLLTRAAPSIHERMSAIQILRELSQQTEAAVARNQLQQLATLPTSDETRPFWNFELPVFNGEKVDLIQLQIEQDAEKKQQDGQRKPWRVKLAFELEQLGALHVQLTLYESQVNSLIWAEREQSVELINQHLKDLHKRFVRHGLNIGELHCQHGTPPQPSKPATAPSSFLDIEV